MSKRKDPNKPKGKLSAYNCFVREEREAIKKSEAEAPASDAESPEKTTGSMAQQAFMVACAEKWKKLSEEEKQRFKEAAEKDKVRYDNEMANYTPPKAEASGRKTRKEKKMKDPNEPKRGVSSFMFFSKEIRAKMKEENPQAAVTAKLLGEMWAKMDEKEKEKYEQMAKEDRERYNEEMKAYRKGDYVVPSTSQVAMEAEE